MLLATTPKRVSRRSRQEKLLHSVRRTLTERPARSVSRSQRRRRYNSSDSDSDSDKGDGAVTTVNRSLVYLVLDATLVELKLLVARHGYVPVGATILGSVLSLLSLHFLSEFSWASPTTERPTRLGDGFFTQDGTMVVSLSTVVYVALCGMVLRMLFSGSDASGRRRASLPSRHDIFTAAQRHASATWRGAMNDATAGAGVPLAPRLAIPDNALSAEQSPQMAGALPPPKRGRLTLLPAQEPSMELSAWERYRTTSVGDGSYTADSSLQQTAPPELSSSLLRSPRHRKLDHQQVTMLAPTASASTVDVSTVVPPPSSISRLRPGSRIAALEAAESAAKAERERVAALRRSASSSRGRRDQHHSAATAPAPSVEATLDRGWAAAAAPAAEAAAALSGIWEAVGRQEQDSQVDGSSLLRELLRLNFRSDGTIVTITGGAVPTLDYSDDDEADAVDGHTGGDAQRLRGRTRQGHPGCGPDGDKELFKVIEGDFDVASGRLRFTQAYTDGAKTHWEARLVGYPHGPPALSSPSAGARPTESPKMVDGSWTGDCEGCFSATLLYTLTLADPLPETELEKEPDIDGKTDRNRKALPVGDVDVVRSADIGQTESQTVVDIEGHRERHGDRRGRVSQSDVGTGRDAAEQAAAQALRMEHERQQQTIKAEHAAESVGIVGASFDKLRAKFFRACLHEAQVLHTHIPSPFTLPRRLAIVNG